MPEVTHTRDSTPQPGEQTASGSDSESVDGVTRPRPEPVLANATYLLRNTKDLLDKIPVKIQEEFIHTDYSTVEAKRAERIANNLRLDMNMFFEEHLQRALERRGTLTKEARRAVQLIHDKLEFASMDPLIKGPLVVQTDLREAQIQQLTKGLENSYPPGSLQEFLDKRDWSDHTFKTFLGTFRGKQGSREHQVADTDMKVLRQLKTQVPYFGGSIEYQQNERCLEYYIYHISTLTRDSKQQYGVDTPQGRLLPKDIKSYHTDPGGKVPFANLRNLGEGVTEEKMPIEKWAPELRKEAEIELNRLRTNFGDADIMQVERLETVEAAWRIAWEQKTGEQAREAPSLAELWNASNEDGRKNLFSNILRLPWSTAHLHGGPGYDQVTRGSDLQEGRSTSSIQNKLPSPPDGKGLMNVAGVYANFLLKPEIASRQYATDPKFQAVQEALDNGTLAEIFPGAVPRGYQTLQKEFEDKHRSWHEEAMANAKPIVGGMSGHTLGYMNLYNEALDKVEPSKRGEYPTPERLRAIMFAGLIGTKRHHSYDEVMSASTGTGNDSIPPESYRHPNSYKDVLESPDEMIRECAENALRKARKSYMQSSNTVLETILSAVESNPKIPNKNTDKLTAAVGEYLKGLGNDQTQASKELSKAVAESLHRSPMLTVKEEIKNLGRKARRSFG